MREYRVIDAWRPRGKNAGNGSILSGGTVCFVSSYRLIEKGRAQQCIPYVTAWDITCTSNMLKLCFRRTSSNIQIKEATTIAAYVAYTHKPLRTNEVLGVRNGKVHFELKLVISRLVKLTQAVG